MMKLIAINIMFVITFSLIGFVLNRKAIPKSIRKYMHYICLIIGVLLLWSIDDSELIRGFAGLSFLGLSLGLDLKNNRIEKNK